MNHQRSKTAFDALRKTLPSGLTAHAFAWAFFKGGVAAAEAAVAASAAARYSCGACGHGHWHSDDQADAALRMHVPGGSQVAAWFLPHDAPAGLANIRHVVKSIMDAAVSNQQQPIPMVLHCPQCGRQHVDAAGELFSYEVSGGDTLTSIASRFGDTAEDIARRNSLTNPDHIRADWLLRVRWGNPPHRSHRCATCQNEWRPADVPTVGVANIMTRGEHDSPLRSMSLLVRTGPLRADEQKAIYDNPAALVLLMDYHSQQQNQSDSMGAETTGNQVRRDELLARGREIIARDHQIWSEEVKAEFKAVSWGKTE